MLWFAVGITLAVLEYAGVMTTARWANFWIWYVVVGAVVGGITTVVFFIGGIRDTISLYRDLRTIRRDDQDDGWVTAPIPRVETSNVYSKSRACKILRFGFGGSFTSSDSPRKDGSD